MSALGSALCFALLGSLAPASGKVVPEPPPSAPETSPDAPTGAARPLVLSVSGVSLADLRAALRLRLGARELLDASARRPSATDFVDVVARDDGAVSYTLITAEGRAFDRTLAPEADQLRALAAAIANLTFAIETGGIEPDRVDVPQPPAPEPTPEPEPAPAPPPAAIAPAPSAKPKPAPATPPAPTWHVGTSLDAGVLLGVAPRTDAGALASGVGRLGLDLRHRRGGLVAVGVRMAGRSRRSLTMLRARIDVGGGWAWRSKRFEVLTAGALTLEPWWVREAGTAATLRLDDQPASRRPLLGALVRVAPGVLLPFGEGDHHAVRVGPRLELAGSFVPQQGARSVDVARANGDGDLQSTLRAGGFEIAIGLDVTLWLGVRRASQRAR